MLLNLYGLTPYGQEGIVQSSVKNNRTARWNWTRGVLKRVCKHVSATSWKSWVNSRRQLVNLWKLAKLSALRCGWVSGVAWQTPALGQ